MGQFGALHLCIWSLRFQGARDTVAKETDRQTDRQTTTMAALFAITNDKSGQVTDESHQSLFWSH